MRTERASGNARWLLCWGLAAAFACGGAWAEDVTPAATLDGGDDGMAMPHHHGHGDHSPVPAGVEGANMVGAGQAVFNYRPMFMHMQDNYIGTDKVSPETIATTVPSGTSMMMPGMGMGMGPGGMMMPEDYRIVPTSMSVQMHMFSAMVGITDWLNLMAMTSYQHKSMTMKTFAGAAGTNVAGFSTASTSGIGDTMIGSLWRVYQDAGNHVHLSLGVSLPTGSDKEEVSMLSPMGMFMTMRGSYGMQLGTGTYDVLPGITYTGHEARWSWGAAYRGRFALDKNNKGYRYGNLNALTGWAGYLIAPGISLTARVEGATQGRISGADPQISGLMQGTNPLFYGGQRINLLGGVSVDGGRWGWHGFHVALEGGAPVYQNLHGPQLGEGWVATLSVGLSVGGGM